MKMKSVIEKNNFELRVSYPAKDLHKFSTFPGACH